MVFVSTFIVKLVAFPADSEPIEYCRRLHDGESMLVGCLPNVVDFVLPRKAYQCIARQEFRLIGRGPVVQFEHFHPRRRCFVNSGELIVAGHLASCELAIGSYDLRIQLYKFELTISVDDQNATSPEAEPISFGRPV